MKVLLKRDIKGLGKAGEVKNVTGGYAANYLIPRGLAVAATPSVLKEFEARRQAEEQKEGEDKKKAGSLAERLSQVVLTFTAKAGEKGRVYGSITSADIAARLEAELGQPFDKRKVVLEQPIHHLGTHRVPIRLLSDVVPEITVIVQTEGE